MTSEYVLRVCVDRHIINTRRPFTDVLRDIRHSVAGFEPERLLDTRIDGAHPAPRFLGRAEFELDAGPGPGTAPGRLVRLLVDCPATTRELVRLLPDAGAYCPVAVLLQQIPDIGTRLAYASVASAISVYQDDASLAVAQALDTDVLTLLRRVATTAQPDE